MTTIERTTPDHWGPISGDAGAPVVTTGPARFTLTAQRADHDSTSHRVRSDYVEDAWLPYIGPVALLVARRMDHALSTQANVGIEIKGWAQRLGITDDELRRALTRLERYGLAEWISNNSYFALARHWPTIPPAIATDLHRSALTALDDTP